MVDIVLVGMPYMMVERPSVALGLLQSALERNGLSSMTLYSNLSWAKQLGLDVYATANDWAPSFQVTEWTFSGAAFPEFEPDHGPYLDSVLYRSSGEPVRSAYLPEADLSQLLWDVRSQAPAFVDRVAESILGLDPRIVGCTSTFGQHCSSLALLRRVKQLDPSINTMMGGANCEGVMGQCIKREFPWIDYVVSGEADELVSDLCDQLLDRGDDRDIEALPYGVDCCIQRMRNCAVGNGTRSRRAPGAQLRRLLSHTEGVQSSRPG